jgi:hypothetical protein
MKILRRVSLAAALLLVLASSAAGVTCSDSPFVETPQYLVGGGPTDLVIGDFDGDSWPDVATVNTSEDTVSVILNDMAGGFGPPIETDLEYESSSMAAADFDANGNLDLAVGSYARVTVLFGNGDGTFQDPVHYDLGSGYIESLVAAPLDAGVSVDLAAGSPQDSGLIVLLNEGDGTFGPPAEYASAGPISGMVSGNFDGSPPLDLLVTHGSGNSISLLPNFGDGTFAPPLSFVAGTSPSSLSAGDLDDDGDLDAVVATESYVSVLKGNGAGSFNAAVQYPARSPYGVVIADFTGEGNLDVATLERSASYGQFNRLQLLAGNGSGGLALLPRGFHVGLNPWALAAGDLDGNGETDIAVANLGSSTAGILLSTGDADFAAALSIDSPSDADLLAPGDFNGDGIPDLASGRYGVVTVQLGDGYGGFATSYWNPGFSDVVMVVAGMFDGDSELDLFVLTRYSESWMLLGAGNGTFEILPTPVPTDYYGYRAAAADFNDDGNLDLAITHECCSNGNVTILLGRGDGTFDTTSPLVAPGNLTGIYAGDLDADGDPDIAAVSVERSSVLVYLGDGNGQFAPGVEYFVGYIPRTVDAGDLTGDTHTDLLVANQGSQNLTILAGVGGGTFVPGPILGLGLPVNAARSVDLDQDSVLDIVTADDGTNTVSVFLGLGNGKFRSPTSSSTDRDATSLAIADFAMNGFPDLAVATPGEGTFTLLRNSRLGVAPIPPSGACVGGALVVHGFAGGFGPVSYQWRKDGIDLADGGTVSGAATSTLTIDPAEAADSGSYDVVVTDTCATANSNAAPVVVSDPPAAPVILLDSPPAPGVAGSASVPAVPGETYSWTVSGDANAVILTGQGTSQITFLAEIPGSVLLDVTAFSAPGCGIAASQQAIPVDFFDVPPGHPFHANIVELARAEITAGCGGGNYCPADAVTRAQMAVFLLKGAHGSSWIPDDVGDYYFTDVPPGSFAEDWINYTAWAGITSGCGSGIYCPGNPVTRAQMAVFILKTEGDFYPPFVPQIFDDVPPGSFAYDFINAIYNEGVTGGCSVAPKLYCPDNLVTRGQMAVFIDRAFLEP